MKIKLSRSDWKLIGDKTGWNKEAQYMPGQTPYTKEELETVHGLVGDAARGDVGEALETDEKALDENDVRRREIKVSFDDGDYLFTTINGTRDEIRRYYLGQDFEKFDETTHKATRVLFLK